MTRKETRFNSDDQEQDEPGKKQQAETRSSSPSVEERLFGGGTVKQTLDNEIGTVRTVITKGPIKEIVHRPGLPPAVTMRDPSESPDQNLLDGTPIALAEARAKGKSVTVFSDGRVEIGLVDETDGTLRRRTDGLVKTIEYPPHHESGLKEAREFIARNDGLIMHGHIADNGDEVKTYADGSREFHHRNNPDRSRTLEYAPDEPSGLISLIEFKDNPEGKRVVVLQQDEEGNTIESFVYSQRTDGLVHVREYSSTDGQITRTETYIDGSTVTTRENETADVVESEVPDETIPDETVPDTVPETTALDDTQDNDISNAARWIALDSIIQMQGSANAEARAEVHEQLRALSPNEARTALRFLAAAMPQRSKSEDGPENRKALFAVPLLFKKVLDDAEAEANIYKLVPYLLELNDKKVTASIRETLDRSVSNCSLSPIQSNEDIRVDAMKQALDCIDPAIRLSAAIALADVKSQHSDKDLASVARKVVYSNLNRMIDTARKLENQNKRVKARAAWKQIDEVLKRIGDTDEDFGRVYVRMRRLELDGEAEEERLVSLYEQLAALSDDLDAPQTAGFYRRKAELTLAHTSKNTTGVDGVRENGEEDPAERAAESDKRIRKLSQRLEKMYQSADAAIKGGDTEKIARIEAEFKECIETSRSIAAKECISLADKRRLPSANAMAALGFMYARQGDMPDAESICREALDIYEYHPDSPRLLRNRALAIVSMTVYSRDGANSEFKQLIAKLLAAATHVRGEVIPLEDGEILREVADRMLDALPLGADSVVSTTVLNADSIRDIETMLQRSLAVRRANFEDGSLQEIDAMEQLTNFYLKTKQADKAVVLAQKTVFDCNNLSGADERRADAYAHLAEVHAQLGDAQQARVAYDSGIAMMTRPGSSLTRQQVFDHLQNYVQLLRRYGDLKHAEDWQMQMQHYDETGVLKPTTFELPPECLSS